MINTTASSFESEPSDSSESLKLQNSSEREKQGKAIIEKSLDDIGAVQARVTERLHLAPNSAEAIRATDEALVHIAESYLDSLGASAEEKKDAVEDVVIESALERDYGIKRALTPAAVLELDGHGPDIDQVIANLHETHAKLPSGHEAAVIMTDEVADLAKHSVMEESPGVVEFVEKAPMLTEVLIQERLKKDESSVDELGIKRPEFTIGDHQVVFRNRQEMPTFNSKDIAVIGAEVSPPLPTLKLNSEGVFVVRDVTDIIEYNKEHTLPIEAAEGKTLVVTNTVEGIVRAAKELTDDESRRTQLAALEEAVKGGDYTSPQSLDSVDDILAAITIDDEGKLRDEYDTDGFALVLAAFSGDAEAKAIVDKKRSALLEGQAAYDRENDRENLVRAESVFGAIEQLPLTEMALVHSTAYPIERDNNGNIILQAASQKRDDKLPRATLHFTVNSQVASNDGGEWERSNKLIVGNLAKSIDASHRNPYVLDGVDTWFTLNPGESIKLPDALVVEGVVDGQLVEDSVEGVKYLDKEVYTAEERSEIGRLSVDLGIDTSLYSGEDQTGDLLKEVALKRALLRQGVPLYAQDSPSGSGHGMTNIHLASRIQKTAAQIGAGWGSHFNHAESYFEKNVTNAMNGPIHAPPESGSGYFRGGVGWSTGGSGVALEVRRQVLVSGYVPAHEFSVIIDKNPSMIF